MKLLLISLQTNAYVTGLKYIAATAYANKHDVKILFLPGYLESALDPAIEKFVRDYNPDLIGIGLMSIEFYPAKNITRLLKKKFQIPIIWGGVHAIIAPEDCLKYADYVCYGEGENPVLRLLEHLRDKGKGVIPDISNIWVQKDGVIVKRNSGPPEYNLDSIPFQKYLPDYFYGFHKNKVYNFAENPKLFRRYSLYGGTCHMLITSRGCPFHCAYCGNSIFMNIYGKKVRGRSVENVIEELKEVKRDPYVLYINIQDDCFFTHSKEWFEKFCIEYKKHINLPFMARVIPTMLDKEKLFMLKKAGLSWIIMGIQSGSDRVNFEVYNRKIRIAQVIKASEVIAESKVAPFYEMIVDNPYETEDDTLATINSMTEVKKPYILSLAHLTFFPGTPIAERAFKDGIADPQAYLDRYLLKFDEIYFNKLLSATPFLPQFLILYLNKSTVSRRHIHSLLTNIAYFITKKIFEPAVYLFIISRSLNFNLKLIAKTILGNWRTALSRIFSNYLGTGDLEFHQKLSLAKKNMQD